jgi:Xaa-Pro aminopeptidase
VSAFERRAQQLCELLEGREIDLLLVTNLVNVRYLCGFAGTNGLCLVGPERRTFVTDFRYVERAKSEVSGYETLQGRQDLLGDVGELLRQEVEDRDARPLRVGFEDATMPVATHAKLSKLVHDRVELVAASGVVEKLRAVKDDEELDAIRRATAIADELYRWLIESHGLAGKTEKAVAIALEQRARELGAEGVSFPPIVAAADNGALPHAEPRDVEIPRDTLVVVDLGCRVDGYCSDCTRTLATGTLPDEAREVYELVEKAQAAAVEAVRSGAECTAVDAAAREPIEQAGRGDLFQHGTGHGVGLEVHERPRLAPSAEGSLVSRNVVTVEPGVYLPGAFGVRIEDLVVVRDDGCEVLTGIPKELTES